MFRRLFLFTVVLSSHLLAQQHAASLPQKHIPPPVLLELRALERQFDTALVHDCAPERCVSKGCLYEDHAVVDMPRASSFPGIAAEEGLGALPPQEYLTQAHCDFAYERAVSPRDVQVLGRRLEQRLSKGWLHVTVGRQPLEPIPPALRESPVPPEPPAPRKVEPPAPAAPPPGPWTRATALRELWAALLPHTFWMIGLLLGTLSVLSILWAFRRLGKESLEEQMLKAQLAAGPPPPSPEVPDVASASPSSVLQEPLSAEAQAEAFWVAEQKKLWNDRLAEEQSPLGALLLQWLKAGEFPLLAKARFVFGDDLPLTFPTEGGLAERKVAFAEYLREVDAQSLLPDAVFFRTLQHHAVAAAIASQSDAALYRSVQEEFGAVGFAHLLERLAPRPGALLFALAPAAMQEDIARALSPVLREQVVRALLVSNRMAAEEERYLFAALEAARAGGPPPPFSDPLDPLDVGVVFDAPRALSALLTHVDAEARRALFADAWRRGGGAYPFWYQEILYPDMLLRVPAPLLADLLLTVEIKKLTGWFVVQPRSWQTTFLAQLPPVVQTALRAGMGGSSRADLVQEARLGHRALVEALQQSIAAGDVTFEELVA